MEETPWETESAARLRAHWPLPRARAPARRGAAAPVAVAPVAAWEPAARWIAPARSDLTVPAGRSQARAWPGAIPAPVACLRADCLDVDFLGADFLGADCPAPRPRPPAAAPGS